MIILIQPSAGELEKAGLRLPLGILCLATYLKMKDIPVTIIDARVNGRWKNKLREKLQHSCMVGISCMIGPMIKNALDIAEFVKKHKPGTTVVLGGVHPTLLPEQVLRNNCVDIVVRGEGERPLVDLLREKSLRAISGISFRDKQGKIIHNSPQRLLSVEAIPIPDYSLVELSKYAATTYSRERSASIMASRGCPYFCGFCYQSNKNYSQWRPFPVDAVLKNVDILVRQYGIRTIYFEDDNIAADRSRFFDILRRVEPYKIFLAFQGIRIDTLAKFTDSMFREMLKCGVRSFDIGVETLNDELLKSVDKHLTSKIIMATLRSLRHYNFNIKFNFIGGLPGQTKQDIEADLWAIKILEKEHRNAYALYNIYMPFPGTRLYSAALKEGFKPPSTFLGWSIFSGTKWMKKYSWLSRKDQQYLQALNFLYMFCGKNIISKVSRGYVRVLIRLYQPIARLRLSRGWFCCLIEKWVVGL